MMNDNLLYLSDAQAVTASAASNAIDIGVARNIGVGEDLYLVIDVVEAFTDSGSDSTVTPKLEADEEDTFGSPTTVRTFDTLPALTAVGTRKIYKLDPGTVAGLYERFLRLYYTVANGDLTTGKISAYITKDVQSFKAYPANYAV